MLSVMSLVNDDTLNLNYRSHGTYSLLPSKCNGLNAGGGGGGANKQNAG
jgi:hypothetical protein